MRFLAVFLCLFWPEWTCPVQGSSNLDIPFLADISIGLSGSNVDFFPSVNDGSTGGSSGAPSSGSSGSSRPPVSSGGKPVPGMGGGSGASFDQLSKGSSGGGGGKATVTGGAGGKATITGGAGGKATITGGAGGKARGKRSLGENVENLICPYGRNISLTSLEKPCQSNDPVVHYQVCKRAEDQKDSIFFSPCLLGDVCCSFYNAITSTCTTKCVPGVPAS